MYIFEVFIKWLNKGQSKEMTYKKPDFRDVDEALTCEHKFMPVDSTGEVLACIKCGFVVKKRNGIDNNSNL